VSKSALEEELALQIRAAKLPEPEREYQFHPTRRWRADFAWPVHKLLVEVQGGIWTGGKHNRGAGMEVDMEKHNEALIGGWRVFQFSASTIKSGRALQYLELVLNANRS
jgi:very-short-patch-repair endonuclease